MRFAFRSGDQVAQGDIHATVAARFGVDTFGIREDSGQPVTFDYKPPNKLTGKIEKIVISLTPAKPYTARISAWGQKRT
jgi:hypothetical protein